LRYAGCGQIQELLEAVGRFPRKGPGAVGGSNASARSPGGDAVERQFSLGSVMGEGAFASLHHCITASHHIGVAAPSRGHTNTEGSGHLLSQRVQRWSERRLGQPYPQFPSHRCKSNAKAMQKLCKSNALHLATRCPVPDMRRVAAIALSDAAGSHMRLAQSTGVGQIDCPWPFPA